jgi:hypothetical protein
MPGDKNQVDNLLITINSTVLIGFLFVFQLTLNHELVKWTLLISLLLFVISLLLLIWHAIRYPLRLKLFGELREKTVKKYSSRIRSFIEDIIVPFSRLKTRDELLTKLGKVKSKEEQEALIQSIENEIKGLEDGSVKPPKTEAEDKATEYVVESFVEQVAHASKADYEKAFKQPLDEKYAKQKLRLDRIAMRGRRHFFAAGAVFIIFSMFVQILSQK